MLLLNIQNPKIQDAYLKHARETLRNFQKDENSKHQVRG
jgi:hypothetical protein